MRVCDCTRNVKLELAPHAPENRLCIGTRLYLELSRRCRQTSIRPRSVTIETVQIGACDLLARRNMPGMGAGNRRLHGTRRTARTFENGEFKTIFSGRNRPRNQIMRWNPGAIEQREGVFYSENPGVRASQTPPATVERSGSSRKQACAEVAADTGVAPARYWAASCPRTQPRATFVLGGSCTS